MSVQEAIEAAAAAVGRLDTAAMARCRRRLDGLTKPPGSLGRLEELAVQMAGITGRVGPEVQPAVVMVCAADHGVTVEGVSAYPAAVTAQMVHNFLRGGAAISVLARAAGARVRVVDAGVAADLSHPDLTVRKQRAGTASMARGPAMTLDEAAAALAAGIALAREEATAGTRVICLGEMGIGNTTAASALLAVFSGRAPAEVTGRGTGLDDAGVRRKAEVIERALAVNRPNPADPIDALAKVGGLEIATLAGITLGAATERLPVLVDGFIASAAALVAARIEPRTVAFMIAAHRSAEPGHRILLELLGLRPLLELDLRLGEGTGAALALPMLQAATKIVQEMATFASAGVAGGPSGEEAPVAAAESPVIVANATAPPAGQDFSPEERRAVYKAICSRRDIRQFRRDLPVPEPVLERLLSAAHQAPSVGLMQPWKFVIVRNQETRRQLWDVVNRERLAASHHFEGERQALYLRLKVEGLLEAPITLCATCDPTRGGAHVLGRNSDPHTDLYSTACAVQNLWLAARAEGLGCGWVSIYKKPDIQRILEIPPHVDPVGLLCLGYTDEFPDRPLLEMAGWERRLPLEAVSFSERWGQR